MRVWTHKLPFQDVLCTRCFDALSKMAGGAVRGGRTLATIAPLVPETHAPGLSCSCLALQIFLS